MTVTGGVAVSHSSADATSVKSAITFSQKTQTNDPLVQITNHIYCLLILHRENQLQL